MISSSEKNDDVTPKWKSTGKGKKGKGANVQKPVTVDHSESNNSAAWSKEGGLNMSQSETDNGIFYGYDALVKRVKWLKRQGELKKDITDSICSLVETLSIDNPFTKNRVYKQYGLSPLQVVKIW